jgi:cellulose synthase operon protein C
MVRNATLVSLPLVCSCAMFLGGGADLTERAALNLVTKGAADARTTALAGWHAYLFEGDVAKAKKFFDQALHLDPKDPVARYAQVELSRRSANPAEEVRAALRLCIDAPADPLCAVAARLSFAAVGVSTALDLEIADKANRALAAGARGDAAFFLKRAVASIKRNQGDDAAAARLFQELGAVSEWRLAGPFSPYRVLDFDRPFSPESEFRFRDTGNYDTPVGSVAARSFRFPDAHLALWAEPLLGDVFYFGADVVAPQSRPYTLRLTCSADFEAWVDGALVVKRQEVKQRQPLEWSVPLELTAGKHRLLLKLARGSERGEIDVLLTRDDAGPSEISVTAASGPPPSVPPPLTPVRAVPMTAQKTYDSLVPETGRAMAAFLAARDAVQRDHEGAKRMASSLEATTAGKNAPDRSSPAPAVSMLRAQLDRSDSSLPPRVASGRAANLLEEITRRDRGEASGWLTLADLALEDSRLEVAGEDASEARKASPESPLVDLIDARIQLARGLDALAQSLAKRASERLPGICNGLVLSYDLARRHDAVALADDLARDLAACPGGRMRLAEHRLHRGDRDAARAIYAALHEAVPADPGPAASLAQVAQATDAYDEAANRYADLAAAWPRNTQFLKRRADALELAGNAAAAASDRAKALAIDGADLTLQRAIAIASGHDLLDDAAIDGREAIAAYERSARHEDAPGVYVLDWAAIGVNPDGSQIERVHTITKVLDSSAVSRLGEVQFPAGAQPLLVRLIKPDGRIFEPEMTGGREGISLSQVEVGDYVDTEYLNAVGNRGPQLPGYAVTRFYFQVSGMPLVRSILEIRTPAGTVPELDAHHMEVDAPKSNRVVIERANVAALIPEPDSPTSEEFLPWVQLGRGAGNAELMLSYADTLADRAQVTEEIAAFAKDAAGAATGLDAVKNVYQRVMTDVKGTDTAFNEPASFVLARGRGNRLLLFRAALTALGISSRIALARSFLSDPDPYRFPTAELYAYPLLVVSPPPAATASNAAVTPVPSEIWLDPNLRYAPFGLLPPQVSGQAAAVLPSSGRDAPMVKTPAMTEPARQLSMKLALSDEGKLTGEGSERYAGTNAAYLKAALETMNTDARRQSIEQALARAYHGAVLGTFQIEESGADIVLKYQFAADGFARRTEDALVIPDPVVALHLGQRFVKVWSRSVPLLVASPEHVVTHIEVASPPKRLPRSPNPPVHVDGPFGKFDHVEVVSGDRLIIDEESGLKMQRVTPKAYPDFADFAALVDRVQGSEVPFVPKEPTVSSTAPQH